MAKETTQKMKRSEWHYCPDVPIGNNPLFEWPWRIEKIIAYHRDYWLTVSEVSFFLILAMAGWFWHQSHLGGLSQLSLDWAFQIYARNLLLVVLIAGGLHYALYHHKVQNTQKKYVEAFGHRGGGRFLFGNQLYDNMFYSLVSGVTIWSCYEIGLHYAHGAGISPSLRFSDNAALFLGLFFVTGIWVAFHFYWGHRFLHWGVMYKLVHSLHHRNVNVGPWSGISMHPIEHVIYFSSLLIHLVIPSHPMHIMFHGYMLALSAVIGHTGFHELLIKGAPRAALGHFHHQLHHRYFECNYGSVDFPLDVWFGTFHDGTEQARERLKRRLGPR